MTDIIVDENDDRYDLYDDDKRKKNFKIGMIKLERLKLKKLQRYSTLLNILWRSWLYILQKAAKRKRLKEAKKRAIEEAKAKDMKKAKKEKSKPELDAQSASKDEA